MPFRLFSKKTWLWEIYFFIYILFVARRVFVFFHPDTPCYFYFYFLRSFDIHFLPFYLVNVLQIFLMVFHCLPLYFYIYRIRVLSPTFWQILLVSHLLCDIWGNSFEINHLASLYHFRPSTCLYVFLESISVYFPAYLACYRYAFGHDKLFPPE